MGADAVFEVRFDAVVYEVFARWRPYVNAFLERVSQLYEVILFTASQKVYADRVLQFIDPEGKYIV